MCGKPVFSLKSIYCRDCSHFSARMSDERFPPEIREQLWASVRLNRGFFCNYTHQKLNVFDYKSPYFLEFDHVIPHNPKHIVMTSSWFNEIKGDMSINELWRSVAQLFNFQFKGIPIKKKKFHYWFRLQPPGTKNK